VLARELREFSGVPRGAREVAAHQIEPGRNIYPIRARRNMRELRDPGLGAANERNRRFNVAQRPRCNRKVKHCRDAGILSEAKGEVVVTPGLKQRDSAFQMVARFSELTGEPMRNSGRAVSDSCLGRIPFRFDIPEESVGVSPRRRQLATDDAADPQAVVGRQPFGRILVARPGLAGSREGFRRFRGAHPSRG
jgi:hypothetical protein